MTGVFCLAGRTQIGKVLKRAAKETKQRKVAAVVFVGDAMEEDLDHLGHLAGELGLLGVPCFMFHEGGDPVARLAFQQIARLSGGAFCTFDSASARRSEEHTSDLQSLMRISYAVFCLNKKTNNNESNSDEQDSLHTTT